MWEPAEVAAGRGEGEMKGTAVCHTEEKEGNVERCGKWRRKGLVGVLGYYGRKKGGVTG